MSAVLLNIARPVSLFNSFLRHNVFGSAIIMLIIAMGALQMADAVMTHIMVNRGLAQEANILVAGLVESGNFILFKFKVVLVSSLAVYFLHRLFPVLARSTSVMIILIYCSILAHNSYVVA